MTDWLRSVFSGRPWWMNALMLFCAYMAAVYVPWDFFAKPLAQDEEVWLGVMFHGWAAKLTEPLHGAIYAAGAYGFYRMRSWMWPWASLYTASVALGMFVWCAVYGTGGLGGVLIGAVAFVPFALLARALWRAKPLFGAPRAPLSERYGEWALVTGASAGLGAAFARALAREGMSCVLTARRGERLEALAAELEQSYGVATRTVVQDLSDPAGARRLLDAVDDLPIALLVSNAGFGQVGRFDKLDPQRLCDMVQLHCGVPVALAGGLVRGMRERGRGAILITGSISGRLPLPLHGVYSATKGFERIFGEALWVELRECGIDVLVVEPGPVETEFQQVADEIAHPGESPERVVELALEALGRQPTLITRWFDWLRINVGTRLVPRPLAAFVARDVIAGWTPEDKR